MDQEGRVRRLGERSYFRHTFESGPFDNLDVPQTRDDLVFDPAASVRAAHECPFLYALTWYLRAVHEHDQTKRTDDSRECQTDRVFDTFLDGDCASALRNALRITDTTGATRRLSIANSAIPYRAIKSPCAGP